MFSYWSLENTIEYTLSKYEVHFALLGFKNWLTDSQNEVPYEPAKDAG